MKGGRKAVVEAFVRFSKIENLYLRIAKDVLPSEKERANKKLPIFGDCHGLHVTNCCGQ